MIVIVVIFLVCQTPAFVNQLVYVIGVADSCGQPYYYYYHLSNIIVSANSAVNFVVYCVLRRGFRRRLREFCRGAPPDPDSPRLSGAGGSVREPWPPKMNASVTNPSLHSSTSSRRVNARLVQLPLKHGTRC